MRNPWLWMRKNKWAFPGVGVLLLGGIGTLIMKWIAPALTPTIQQRSEGPNSPNIVGNSNVISYAAEPAERTLPPKFVSAISRFAGQPFWLIMETNDYDQGSEQMRFGQQLAAAITAAGWVKTQQVTTRQRGSTEFKQVPQPLYVRVSDRGVIVYAADSSMAAAAAVRDELSRGLKKTELAYDENLKDAVVIVVGLQ